MALYYSNLLIPFLVLLPNVVYIWLKPRDRAQAIQVNVVFNIFEKIGQAGLVILPLFFPVHINLVLVIPATVALIAYYLVWLRYFRKRTLEALYGPVYRIPTPLALLPVIFFFFVALLFNETLIYVAWLVFAVGHIGVSARYAEVFS